VNDQISTDLVVGALRTALARSDFDGVVDLIPAW